MAHDPVAEVKAELTEWMSGRSDRVRRDASEARMLLDLLRDHLGVADPRALTPEHLDELLLRVYPHQVTVTSEDDLGDVIPAVRDILAFVADTGRQPASSLDELRQAVDRIEPRFAGSVMNPENWGWAKSITQAMADDGVDLDDTAAMSRWIDSNRNGRGGPGGPVGPAEDDGADDEEWDEDLLDDDLLDEDLPPLGFDPDVLEALGLPEWLPPIRLPDETELAAAARETRVAVRLRELVRWAGDRRDVDPDGELSAEDAVAAAATVGLSMPGEVTSMAELPELVHLWRMAEHGGLLEVCTDHVHVHSDDEQWADDDEVLDLWNGALGYVLGESLTTDVELDGRTDVQFGGTGGLMATMLFLARDDGVELDEISELMREAATADLEPAAARKAWKSWLRAHGDPARTLATRLEEHGAATVDRGTLRLLPLGYWAMREQLEALGVIVPMLPPVEEMSAADLVAAAMGLSPEQLSEESSAWLETRPLGQAVDELLAVATVGGAAQRMLATSIVGGIGAAAEEKWRQALDQEELRPYAKAALASIAVASSADELPADLHPDMSDVAWLLTDLLASMLDEIDADELVVQMSEVVPQGREAEIFDVMWRLPHPDVHEVLTKLGQLHPDTAVAKAARKASFKVSRGS